MTISRTEYIFETDYYERSWTWVKRVFEFVLFAVLCLYLEAKYPGEFVLKLLLLMLCGLVIFFRPIDDLAIDSKYLYYFKRSAFPYFSKTSKYQIAKMKTIKCGGIYSSSSEILLLVGSFSNSIEIIFDDNSSTALDVPIYREELDEIVMNARELMAKKTI